MARQWRVRTGVSALAVALVAAAIGDPLVESIANAGFFGATLVFSAQLAVVCVIECVEALLGGGQAIRGLSWLGAPAALGLIVHLGVCIATLMTLRRATRALVAGALAALFDALERLVSILTRPEPRAFGLRSNDACRLRFELVASRRLHGRAPPAWAA